MLLCILLITLGMSSVVVYFAYFIRNCVVLLCIERIFAYFIRNCVVLLSIERILAYFIRNVLCCCLLNAFLVISLGIV